MCRILLSGHFLARAESRARRLIPALRQGARALPFLACSAFAGCSESILLGSECPGPSGVCPSAVPADGADASVAEAGPLDAARPLDGGGRPRMDTSIGPTPEAAADGGLPLWGRMPALANRSFELKGGDFGDITTVNSTIPGGTSIAPWYTCQPIGGPPGLTAVRSTDKVERLQEDGGVVEVVLPTDADALVHVSTIPHLLFPLFQKLEEPLVPGTRYSFALDLRALAAEPALTLQVSGSSVSNGCSPDELLEESLPLTTEWQPFCFDFVPTAPHQRLLLQAKSALLVGSLVFDNLREASAETCRASNPERPRATSR